LVRELARRGHDVLFLERDVPWYRENRDLPHPPFGRSELYGSLEEVRRRFRNDVRRADLVIVGSFVPEGVALGEWVIETAGGVAAFYDIDTPVTLGKLSRGDYEYLTPHLIPRYDLYLSFTGGPLLDYIENHYGSPMARVLYCSVDPDLYYPEPFVKRWDLGYLGTYADDRQPFLDCLLMEPARRWKRGRFIVAGPLYPGSLRWPANVERIEHIAPAGHRRFYNAQRVTLNLTRGEMKAAGYSPSVRLFEAAACGVAIVSDYWHGLESLFEIGREILVANSSDEILRMLRETSPEQLKRLGVRIRERIRAEHTAAHRALELETYFQEAAQSLTRAAG
jgi:spore maturation protein CgeB